MSRSSSVHFARIAAVVLAFTHLATAQEVDVTGSWLFTVETSSGSGSPTMTFKQDGSKLTGTYQGLFGKAPLEGTLEGRKIQFTFTADVEGQPTKFLYQGTVESATTMKGTVDMGGGALTGTFTAEKQPPPKK